MTTAIAVIDVLRELQEHERKENDPRRFPIVSNAQNGWRGSTLINRRQHTPTVPTSHCRHQVEPSHTVCTQLDAPIGPNPARPVMRAAPQSRIAPPTVFHAHERMPPISSATTKGAMMGPFAAHEALRVEARGPALHVSWCNAYGGPTSTTNGPHCMLCATGRSREAARLPAPAQPRDRLGR